MNLIETHRYLIAYLDLLGIKKKLCSSDKKEQILTMTLLEKVINDAKYGSYSTEFLIDNIDVLVFSDNILIAYDTEKSVSEQGYIDEVCKLVLYVMCLQTMALVNGFFLRGSIGFGDLYIDKKKNFVCGSGLITAYTNESQNAIYPRIITDDSELLNIVNAGLKLQNGYVISKPFTKDNDSIYFLDYLQMLGCIKQDLPMHLLKNKEHYEKYQVLLPNEDEKVKSKHQWHINYFNNYCKQVGYAQNQIEVNYAE